MTPYPLNESDLEKLKTLHELYYKEQFNFPDFRRTFLTTFKILDSEENIVTAGGVKLFPEMILITDKNADARKRYDALMLALGISQLSAHSYGSDTLHASSRNDENWEKILIKIGFQFSRDNNLVI
jgi:hypothetical protein